MVAACFCLPHACLFDVFSPTAPQSTASAPPRLLSFALALSSRACCTSPFRRAGIRRAQLRLPAHPASSLCFRPARSRLTFTSPQNQAAPGPAVPPPSQPLQHPRSAGLVHQHRPHSPHHPPHHQPTPQGPYISPHASTPNLPQHHSPYVGSVPGIPPQAPGESTFFGAHPSPYSTNSAAGSYASSGMRRPFFLLT